MSLEKARRTTRDEPPGPRRGPAGAAAAACMYGCRERALLRRRRGPRRLAAHRAPADPNTGKGLNRGPGQPPRRRNGPCRGRVLPQAQRGLPPAG